MDLRQRNQTIDIMRGIGILVMIWGHINLGIPALEQPFSFWYHAFHMPLFYVISGFLYKRKDEEFGHSVLQKAKHLLVPYYFWGVFNLIYNLIESGDFQEFRFDFIHTLILTPTRAGIPCAGALWFLPALFWIYFFYSLADRLVGNKWILWGLSAVVSVCGMVLASKGIQLPFALDGASSGIIFMAFGDFLQQEKERPFAFELMNMRWYLFVPLFLIFNVLFVVNGDVNFRSGHYSFIPLTILNACVGFFLIHFIADRLNKSSGVSEVHILIGLFTAVGRDSLVYVCLNQRIIYWLEPIYLNHLPEFIPWQIAARATSLLTVAVVCHCAAVLWKKIKGKEYRIWRTIE